MQARIYEVLLNSSSLELRAIIEYEDNFLTLLQQVGQTTKEEAVTKCTENGQQLVRLHSQQKEKSFSVYFGLYECKTHLVGIGAIKYCHVPIRVRKLEPHGLVHHTVGPYMELGDIAILPSHQGQKLSRIFYVALLQYLKDVQADKISTHLLIGAHGQLSQKLQKLYSECVYTRDLPCIPKEAFTAEEWQLVGQPRSETKGTAVYCERLGLCPEAIANRHGGPLYTCPDFRTLDLKKLGPINVTLQAAQARP